MSNPSLRLGGGKWAAKKRSLLLHAEGESSGRVTRRRFNFSREADYAATRINKEGLVEKLRRNRVVNSGFIGSGDNISPHYWHPTDSNNGNHTNHGPGQIRFTTRSDQRKFILTRPIDGFRADGNGIFTQSIYVDKVFTAVPVNQLISTAPGDRRTLVAYFEDGQQVSNQHMVQAGKRYSAIWDQTGICVFRFGCGCSSNVEGDIVISRPQVEVGFGASEYIETLGNKNLLYDSGEFGDSGGSDREFDSAENLYHGENTDFDELVMMVLLML